MDQTIDRITRTLGSGDVSRRGFLRIVGAVALAAALGVGATLALAGLEMIGVVLAIDHVRLVVSLPPGTALTIAAILVLQAYLVFAPRSETS